MGVWTLKYRSSVDSDFSEAESVGAAGIPPFFDQITTDQFIQLEIFATHSDEDEVTFYKPFNTRDWEEIRRDGGHYE